MALLDDQGTTNKESGSKTERLLSEHEVCRRSSLSRVTIWRLQKAGRFPPHAQISPGRKAWSESAISAWIDARLAEVAE
jgi:predicted DNA-binding transcriptional regulator AlpA